MKTKPTGSENVAFNIDLIGKQPEVEGSALDLSKGLRELLSIDDRVLQDARSLMDQMQAPAQYAMESIHPSKGLQESLNQTAKWYESLRAFATPSESAQRFLEQQKRFSEALSEQINRDKGVFKQLQEWMNTPESKGLSALLGILEGAKQNADIQNSKAAVEVLDLFHTLLSMARLNASADEIMTPLVEHAEKSARSNMASQNARRKNAKLREWVVQQWSKYKTKGYSKTRFARWCIANPPQGIPGRLPSVEQIVREWLKEK